MWWLYILLCAFYGNYYDCLCIYSNEKFLFGVNLYAFITMTRFNNNACVFTIIMLFYC